MFKELETVLVIISSCMLILLLTFGIIVGCCEHEDITIITQDNEVLHFHSNDCYWEYDSRSNSFAIGNETYCNIKYINIEYISWCSCKNNE